MKRDMDLIREILLFAEATAPGELTRDFTDLNRNQIEVTEHIWLAQRSGLLIAQFGGDTPSTGVATIQRLTPAGHDFLAQSREPAIWNKAKETVVKAGTGATVEVMKTVLTHLATVAVTAALAGSR